MEEFENKTVIITGGSRGIGKEIAKTFTKAGANVIFNYLRNHQAARETLDELQQYSGRINSIQCNMGDEKQIFKFVDEVVRKYKSIDILVNNAATAVMKSSLELTSKHWDWSINASVKGLWLISKECANHMVKHSKIVNISSLGANRYIRDYFAMGVSKAAIEAITRFMAVDLASKKINVNSVSAGLIETESLKAFGDEHFINKKETLNTPLGRQIEKYDIANLVMFLASRQADMISGQTFLIDATKSLPIY